MTKIFKPEKISLLNNPDVKESLIQEKIAENPSILGLGDLILKDKERIQPRAGRLDLLLQDPDTQRRYEVEIQLGKTDESHIIRTIEYWDSERKRYPQYDHCAVIVAEDITTRFNNVIGLFNGSIPIIAIQMNAYKFGDDIGLVFTTVLDELTLGLVDDDEEVKEVTDRKYWVNRGTEKTVKMADELLAVINEFSGGYELKYNKFYIGLAKDGQPKNFVVFRPRKSGITLEIKIPYSEEVQKKIEENGLDDMGYLKRWGVYRLRLNKEDIKNKAEILKELFHQAYENSK
jgi:predicted transport protein